MRQVTLTCDVCGLTLRLDRSKEVLVKTGNNAYHLFDLCADCLDTQLKGASSVNDTKGFRHKVAALITPANGQLPRHRAS